MLSYLARAAFLTLLGLFASPATAKVNKICDHITVMDGKLKLNDNERVLVCGSRDGGEGWRTIPIPQAILHLKSIAQSKAYLKPRFERVGENLNVWLGSKTEVSNLRVEGADGVLRAEKKRKIVGFPLEPAKLNEVEAWAYSELRRQGYACAQVAIEAHEWDLEVVVKTKLDSRKKVGHIDVGNLDGLHPEVMNRYRPFGEGEFYDVRKTQLMTSRLLSDGLVQSAYFNVKCRGDFVDLKLETSVGKPKIFRFGVGASTEELPFVDGSFKNARLDNDASSFTAVLHGSPRKYSFTLGSELYWIPNSYRSFFGPRFEMARKSESAYETNTIAGGVDIGRKWDAHSIRYAARWGPTLNYSKRVSGTGPEETTYPTIDASFGALSHNYESSIRDQYEGWTAEFFYRGQSKGLGSKVDVNRYRVDFKSLWNIGGFSPPLFIIGTRIEAIAVDTDEITGQNRDLLPVEDRIYLGGDQNLRGFARQSINNIRNGVKLGYLTSLYIGFELRLIEELPYRIQPFLLFDAARVGDQRYTLERPIFASEGLGLRWASPFGTLRGSIARGHVIDSDASTAAINPNWVIFGSFGQEF